MVYIYQSFRKKDGKSSSRIYKKLGKYNTLLERFDGNADKLMAWARDEAAKETEFEARPVYVRRDDRIKAHFMTCYISLLFFICKVGYFI